MRAVQSYSRPPTLDAALEAARREPGAAWLAGGTILLAGDYREKPETVLDLGAVLPAGITRDGNALVLGAGATFQDLVDSDLVPPALRRAAASMANRNARNRATVGGNLAAGKSCASLVPVLLALGARVERASTADGKRGELPLADWLAGRRPGDPVGNGELVLSVTIPEEPGRLASFARWGRSACDLSILTAGVSFVEARGAVTGLRIAMGGLGPRARLFPELASLFEGRPLPAREAVETAAVPLLSPIDDHRGSAAFKRGRAAALLAEALEAAGPAWEGARP